MRIDIISLFPEIFSAFNFGVVGRARARALLEVHCWNPRDYTYDKYKTVDDHPYGGGPGMLMKVAPLQEAIQAAKQAAGATPRVIYLSPQGRLFDQKMAEDLVKQPRIILLAGHYEGVDERILSLEIDEELSIGDYVLSGGEFAAMVIVDAIVRLLPGALGNKASAEHDSLSQPLLEYPQYTRPVSYKGQVVPEVLLSGDHQAIATWRLQQSLGRTWLRRPDLLAERVLTQQEKALLTEFINARGQ